VKKYVNVISSQQSSYRNGHNKAQASVQKERKMEMKNIAKVGFYSALLTTLMTLVTWAIAILTPPLSGPYCIGGCYTYPFADIASRFPRDYFWMYPAILLSLIFYALMVSVHYFATGDKKVFSHLGMSFALISTATLVIDYFLQVSVIQPSLVLGETNGIALLSQFNAHGVFIVLEEIGFFMMSLSMLFMSAVFVGKTRSEKAIRLLFILCFVLNIFAFTLYSIIYGVNREYRFEVATISINWLTLIPSGILLSVIFRKALTESLRQHKSQLSAQRANA
jgi:hypothetical protein